MIDYLTASLEDAVIPDDGRHVLSSSESFGPDESTVDGLQIRLTVA
jgi:hypothetical protein